MDHSNGRRVEDQTFPTLLAALQAFETYALGTGLPAQCAAFIRSGEQERVTAQFAFRTYWLQRARSSLLRSLLTRTADDDARVFVFGAVEGSWLLRDALANERAR